MSRNDLGETESEDLSEESMGMGYGLMVSFVTVMKSTDT